MKEAVVQTWVKAQVKSRYPDCFIFKVVQGRYSAAGIPDLVGVINGKFIAIEVKTDKGKLSALQNLALGAIRQAGGIAHVVYGKNEKHMARFYLEVDSETS